MFLYCPVNQFLRTLCILASQSMAWFRVWLLTLRVVGLRLVWTAHNVVPHEPVFDDDVEARKTLIRFCDAVIAHDESTAEKVRRNFGATSVYVIPQGAYEVVHLDRDASRAELGWINSDQKLIACVGAIRPYKGFSDLLRATLELAKDDSKVMGDLKVLIAGQSLDALLSNELSQLAKLCRSHGVEVRLHASYLSEHEVAVIHSAADAVALPFRSVSNSASLVTALSYGRLVIATELESIAEVGDGAIIWHGPGVDGIKRGIGQFLGLSESEQLSMEAKAIRWASTRNWSVVAKETKAVYAQVLN